MKKLSITLITSLGRGLSAAMLLFASAQFALAQSIVTSPPQGPTAQWSAADRASAQPAPMPTVTGRPTAAASQARQAAGDPEVVPGNTASNALRVPGVRILAPVPGKPAVGIEVANPRREEVTLRELIEADAFAQRREQPGSYQLCLEQLSGPVKLRFTAARCNFKHF